MFDMAVVTNSTDSLDTYHFVCGFTRADPHRGTCTLTFEEPARAEGPALATVTFTVSYDTAAVAMGEELVYPAAATDPKVPVKVLRGFKKSCEKSTSASFTLTDLDVSNWDIAGKAFKETKGTYQVFVGRSSQDIVLTGTMTV